MRSVGSFERLTIREPRNETSARRRFKADLTNHFAGNPNFTFFRTEGDFLRPDGQIRWWDGKAKLFYFDDDHVSEDGVDLFLGRLARTLVAIVEGARK